MLNNHKHIIWDWNGTLFNDVELCHDIINGILIRNGVESLSLQRYRNIFTFPVKDYYEKAGLDFSKVSFEVLGREFMAEYELRKLECELYPGAEELIIELNKNGFEQSILSAYSHHTLIEIVKHFKIDKYFIGLAGLDNIYAGSKLEIGKKLINKSGIKNGEALMIGDTVHDFEVAKGIGADCLLVANGHQSKEQLLKCGALVVDNLASLLNGELKTFSGHL